MTVEEALKLLISKRPVAEPNRGYMRQLKEFEAEVLPKNSSP